MSGRPTATAAPPGRLASGPDPELFELLYAPQLEEDRRRVLPHLLRIDAAHLVMLGERSILPVDQVADLLAVNLDLDERHARGEDIVPTEGSAPRPLLPL